MRFHALLGRCDTQLQADLISEVNRMAQEDTRTILGLDAQLSSEKRVSRDRLAACDNFTLRVQAQNAEIDSLRDSLHNAEVKAGNQDKAIDTLRLKLAGAETGRKEAVDEVRSLALQAVAKDREICDLRRNPTYYEGDIVRLKETIADRTAQVGEQTAKVMDLEAENKVLNADVDRLTAELAAACDKIGQRQGQASYESLRESLDLVTSHLEWCRTLQGKMRKANTNLYDRLQAEKTSVARLNKQVGELRERLAGTEKANEILVHRSTQVDSLTGQCDKLSDANDTLYAEIQEIKARRDIKIQELEEQLNAAKDLEISDLKHVLSKVQAELLITEGARKSVHAANCDLTKELEVTRAKLVLVNSQLGLARKETGCTFVAGQAQVTLLDCEVRRILVVIASKGRIAGIKLLNDLTQDGLKNSKDIVGFCQPFRAACEKFINENHACDSLEPLPAWGMVVSYGGWFKRQADYKSVIDYARLKEERDRLQRELDGLKTEKLDKEYLESIPTFYLNACEDSAVVDCLRDKGLISGARKLQEYAPVLSHDQAQTVCLTRSPFKEALDEFKSRASLAQRHTPAAQTFSAGLFVVTLGPGEVNRVVNTITKSGLIMGIKELRGLDGLAGLGLKEAKDIVELQDPFRSAVAQFRAEHPY